MNNKPQSRRDFLAHSCTTGAAAMLSSIAARQAFSKPKGATPRHAAAEACIFIWLGGGACQIDTWDPKRKSTNQNEPGSYYDAIDTAIPGVQVCEHLARTAPLLDRCALMRTVHHNALDEHAAATNLLHTGRPTSGTIIYPSIGSVVAHERGPAHPNVPAYVVIGYPNVTRGPGFLGAKHGYVYLLETKSGPNGLKRPQHITDVRHSRRERLLGEMRKSFLQRNGGDNRAAEYAAAAEEGFRLAGPQFMQPFELDREPDSLRNRFGGEFGQRLLLARRLVQSGVRFIEVSSNQNFVNGTGWDTHNEGQLKQHLLIQELDQGLSALLIDLEKNRMLDKTLVVVATEFGRPPEFDSGGGRGHHSDAFSFVLAGGGLRTGQAIGTTDELGRKPIDRPVSVPDLFATIHHALGIDPEEELYDGDRPVPITDQGVPVAELF